MNRQTYQTIYSSQIFLNSSQASEYYNDNRNSSLKFKLKDVIKDQNDILEVRLSLVNAQFPYSFYNIYSGNDNFNITINSVLTTYTFPHGNYNVNTFISTWISTFGSGWTITYNTILNKFTFSYTSDFIFSDNYNSSYYQNNSMYPVIGGLYGVVYASVNKSVTMDYCYNFGGINRLNVVLSNINTSNYDSYNQGITSTLASVPINCNPTGKILYTNYTNFKTTIDQTEMSNFSIKILDDNKNTINFNNQDWTMTLQIDIVKEIIIDKSSFEDYYKENINDNIELNNMIE
jgi:hypothetical protein